MNDPVSGRPLFFYSAFPLGYHNPEAERKAVALAQDGWDVTYVLGVGFRDPRPASLAKIGDRVIRKLRSRGPEDSGPAPAGVSQGAVLVVPPRRVRAVRRFNAMWLERQLRSMIGPWGDALAWIRWPTPELTDALRRLRPAGIVYECVDAYHETPGAAGPWKRVAVEADRELALLADVVVTASEHEAARFRALGRTVRVIPHGVDLGAWRERPRPRNGEVTVGFVGTLDYKLDIPVLRAIAESHPEWKLRLVGPIQAGFDPADLQDLPNVSVEPPVPSAQVAELNASFDAGIMPYFDHPVYTASNPLKNLEYLAAGTPAVARPTPSLAPYADIVSFAATPAEFVAQLERVIAHDSPARARARRAIAEANTWEQRLDDVSQVARAAGGTGARARAAVSE
jgi:glycosyltransferase involved in cell wall biosynthesis